MNLYTCSTGRTALSVALQLYCWEAGTAAGGDERRGMGRVRNRRAPAGPGPLAPQGLYGGAIVTAQTARRLP